jgi:hypothetical protein
VHELEILARFFGFSKNSSDNFSMEIKVLQQTKITVLSIFLIVPLISLLHFFTGLTFPECFVSFDAHCLFLSGKRFYCSGIQHGCRHVIMQNLYTVKHNFTLLVCVRILFTCLQPRRSRFSSSGR